MKKLYIALMYVVFVAFPACMLLSGCSDNPLRFAASEPQRQNAQAAADLAAVAHRDGLPPGSAATERLAAAADATLIYTGTPEAPVNVEALAPPAVRAAWPTRDEQVRALRLKQQLAEKARQLQARQLAGLADELKDQTKARTAEIIGRLQNWMDTAEAIGDVADSIDVPGDPQMSEAERALQEEVRQLARQVATASRSDAVQRPTGEDILDAGLQGADQVGDLMTALGVGAIPGVGGIVAGAAGWVKQARKAREAAAEKGRYQQAVATIVPQVDSIKALIPPESLAVVKTILSGQSQDVRDVVSEYRPEEPTTVSSPVRML